MDRILRHRGGMETQRGKKQEFRSENSESRRVLRETNGTGRSLQTGLYLSYCKSSRLTGLGERPHTFYALPEIKERQCKTANNVRDFLEPLAGLNRNIGEIRCLRKSVSIRDDMIESPINRTVENAEMRGRTKLAKHDAKIEIHAL